jgi:hypothetical protein
MLTAGLATALPAAAASIEDELAAIKARLQALERQVQEQNRVIADKDRQIEALQRDTPRILDDDEGPWADRVRVGGLVEIEAGYDSSGSDTSDITVATAELAIGAQVNDWVGAEIVLLHEEDEPQDLVVDIAAVTFAQPDGPWYLTAGRQYVPFGTFETYLVSDPLTLEIGETNETAVVAGFAHNGFGGAAYVFNGDSDAGHDVVDRFGATLGYSQQSERGSFSANLGYISHIGDSDGLDVGPVSDFVAGYTVDALFSSGPFTVIAEYTAAADSFTATELPFGAGGAEPKAWNLEAAYALALFGRDATVALGYGGTDEAQALGLPEARYAAALSVAVMDNTALSFEWAINEDYGVADGGTGKNTHTGTAQLAVEF